MNAEAFTRLPALTCSLSSCLCPSGRTGKEAGCRQAQKQLCADALEPLFTSTYASTWVLENEYDKGFVGATGLAA